MRDLLLIAVVLCLALPALRKPHVGLFGWLWLSIMAPHFLSYGISTAIPLVMIMAACTFIGMALNPKELANPLCPVTVLVALFMLWFTVTTFQALDYDYSSWRWERALKVYLIAFILVALINSKVRLQALAWLLVATLAFYLIKGGLFTVATGGGYRVFGPLGSPIADNNYTAATLLMVIPLIVYLYRTTESPLLRIGLLATVGLGIFSVVGTHSRGGLVGLAAVAAVYWAMSRHKIGLGIAAALMLVAVWSFVPPEWTERMATITTADEDNSFNERLRAWEFAIVAAESRLTGVGFSGTEIAGVFQSYLPGAIREGKYAAAAHSIYFQVLGDHGFPGLFIYLALLATAFWNTLWVRWRTHDRADLHWAFEFATACMVALTGYVVAGAALSLAHLDLPVAIIATTAALRLVVARYLAADTAEALTDEPAYRRRSLTGNRASAARVGGPSDA